MCIRDSPTYQPGESPIAPLEGTPISADAFGAGTGRGLEQAGAALAGVASTVGTIVSERNAVRARQDVASRVAQFDFTADFADEKLRAAADGRDFVPSVRKRFDASIAKYLGAIDDPDVRAEVKRHLEGRRPQIIGEAVATQDALGAHAARSQADTALSVVANRVRADPSQYDVAIADGQRVIDALPQSEAVRGVMSKQLRETLARSRFEAMASKAETPEQLRAIMGELEAPPGTPGARDWQKEMTKVDYDRLLDQMRAAQRALESRGDAVARSEIQGLQDRTRAGVAIDPAEIAAVGQSVARSQSPAVQWAFEEIRRKQEVFRTEKNTPPAVLRERIDAGIAAQAQGVPAHISAAADEASALTGGRIASRTLLAIAKSEYGNLANPNTGLQTQIRGPDGRPTSDATGIGQVISTTWLNSLTRWSGVLGIDIRGKSREELLALRADPALSLKVTALLADENAKLVAAATGRAATDADIYAMHFLGSGAGPGFIVAAERTPNAPASAAVPMTSIEANRPVFYDKDGGMRSVRQVYDMLALKMAQPGTPAGTGGRADYAATEARQLLYRQQQTGLREDAVRYLAQTGAFKVDPLTDDPASYTSRGNLMRAAADYYELPLSQLKPLSKDEVERITRFTKGEGSAEETLKQMVALQALGPNVAAEAYKQIGEKDPVFAHAAGLAVAQGNTDVAADVIKGERQLRIDKDVRAAITVKHDELTAAFDQFVGRSIIGAGADNIAAIRQAALAHYVQTQIVAGTGGNGRFNLEGYKASISAVMGGSKDRPAIESVNGAPMVVPSWTTGKDFDKALDRMTDADYQRMSVDGNPPRFANGDLVKPYEIAAESRFEYVGSGQYRLRMADDKFAVVEKSMPGKPERYYLFRPDPAVFKEALTRNSPAEQRRIDAIDRMQQPRAGGPPRMPPTYPNAPGSARPLAPPPVQGR